jgi:uncharacterized protein
MKNKKLYTSRYNLAFNIKTKGKSENLLFNTLSGALDIVDNKIIDELEKIKQNKETSLNAQTINSLLARDYLYNSKKEEDERIKQSYDKFIKLIESARIPRIYVLGISTVCNLTCDYCLNLWKPTREVPEPATPVASEKAAMNAIKSVEKFHSDKKNKDADAHVIISGGEPLLKSHYNVIKLILEQCHERDYLVSITTNGTEISNYYDIITKYNPAIQLTIDGPKEMHDKRRRFKDGRGSFDLVVEAVDYLKDQNVSLPIHSNYDWENFPTFPKLADFYIEKGWTDYKNIDFRMKPVGSCGSNIAKALDHKYGKYHERFKNIMSKTDAITEFYRLLTDYPNMKIFKLTDAWFGFSSLINSLENGFPSIYRPAFKRSLWGGKCGYTLGYCSNSGEGSLWTCPDSVLLPNTYMGKLYGDKMELFEKKLDRWNNIDIFTNSICSKCSANLLCGGGCHNFEFIGKGEIKPCEGVEGYRKILKTVFQYYYPKIKEKAEAD